MTAIETTASEGRPGGSGFNFGAGDESAGLKDKVTRFVQGYSPRQRAIAGGVVAAVLIGMLVVSRMTGGTEYAPLYTDVSPEDGGAIIAELEKQGIAHKVSAGGTSILVPADSVHETRMAMSSVELPGDSKIGYGVLDSQGLTTSEFGQRVGFQRAMEGELARTIESLDAVDTAVVHLALPAEQVFARDSDKPSASVLIRTVGSDQLNEDQVRAVVNLVASGIEGMTPDQVTVADSEGNVLSAPGQGVNAPSGGGTRQRQTADFETGLQTSLEDLLDGVVGAGGAKVSVNAELNFDERNVTRETFEAPEAGVDGNPLRTEESTRTETYAGDDPTTGGVLGPDTPATLGTDGATDYGLEEADVRFAVNRAIETTNEAPGRIERLSVAVAVDSSKVSAAQMQDLRPLIEAGAGISAERGDVISVSRTAFDDGSAEREAAEAALQAEEEARAAAARGSMFRNIAIVVALLVVALVAFLAHRRSVRRRDDYWDELPAGDATPELPPAPVSVVADEFDEADVLELSSTALETTSGSDVELAPLVLDPTEQARVNRQTAVAELIEHQPDEVAALLRSWLGDRRAVGR